MRSAGMLPLLLVLALGVVDTTAVFAQDVTLSGQVRPRYESRDPVAGVRDDFISMRTRLTAAAAFESGLSIFAQVQDVRLFGEESHPLFDYSANGLDMHQGYLRLQLEEWSWLTTTIGRLETPLGGERLIGAVGWAQQAQSFDGVRFDVQRGRLHLVAAGFIVSEASAAGVDEDEDLFTIYGTVDDVGPGVLEVYWINDRTSAATESNEHLFGSRYIFGGSIFGRVEATLENGTRNDTDVSAFLLGGRAGTAFDEGRLTATLWYDYLSGDDPDTPELEVFNTLYGTNHKFYGFADLFLNIPANTGGAGLQDMAVKLGYQPLDKLSTALAVHSFRAAAGSGLTDSHFGEEIDVTVTHPYSSNLTASLGFSYVFQADGLAEIGRLDEDMTWLYVMLNATF